MVGSVTSAGTGVDIHAMARQMAMVQTQPRANQLARRENNVNGEVKALNELSDAINAFYNSLDKLSQPSTFGSLTVKMDDDDKKSVDVSVDGKATANTYQLQVHRLATRNKIQLFSSDAGKNTVRPGDAGDYTIKVADKKLALKIGKGDTLADIANRINDSDDNPGVTASIISDGKHTYLTMTANETGIDNSIGVMKGAKPAHIKKLKSGENASFSLDGISLTSSSNTIKNAVKGVTLELKKTTEEAVRVDINPDTSTMVSSGKEVTETFNTLLKVINKLTKTSIDEKTGVRHRATLASDSMVSSLRTELRDVLQQSFDGPFSSLASIGIISKRNGELEVDSSKLRETMEAEPKKATRLFMDVMKDFQDVATKYIGRPESDDDDEDKDDDDKDDKDTSGIGSKPYIPKDGLIDKRIDSLNEDLRGIRGNVKDLQLRFKAINQRYLKEYIAMNKAVARMRQSLAGLL